MLYFTNAVVIKIDVFLWLPMLPRIEYKYLFDVVAAVFRGNIRLEGISCRHTSTKHNVNTLRNGNELHMTIIETYHLQFAQQNRSTREGEREKD